MALINPNQVHSGVPLPSKQVSYRMVYLDARLVETATAEIIQQLPGIPEFSCTVVEDPLLWRSLQRLCRIMQGPGGRLEKESAVMDAMVHLAPFHGQVPARGRAVRGSRKSMGRAKALLAENLERKISLTNVARAAGLSRYHFLRVFKQATGLPPHLYRNLRRIERAKQLLRRGQPLADIALTVGFSDQSHLTNTFRKYTGATPGQYATKSCGQRSLYKGCSAKQ
jgi:AraC-like DNA-binding protein